MIITISGNLVVLQEGRGREDELCKFDLGGQGEWPESVQTAPIDRLKSIREIYSRNL